MKVIRQVALVSGQDVFGTVVLNSAIYPEVWASYISNPQIVEIPSSISDHVGAGWLYDGENFTAPENYISTENHEGHGETGFAVIKDGVVVDSFYPDPSTELGARHLAGLSSSPIMVEVPEDYYVFPGDTWDGEKFNR